ncbi:MAG: hypothetical protein BWX71_01012 [Deltaproteobacteria bacterium ADurb.Bin072]|nr:MAG: hypothetical protein BWX71_01012 [Deltaproteobacteria bacterium ADurb.Bin072]
MSGKRGPYSSLFGPASGFLPVKLRWSVMSMALPGSRSFLRPPAAFEMSRFFTPSILKTRMGAVTSSAEYPS